jgi:hypothetical protein
MNGYVAGPGSPLGPMHRTDIETIWSLHLLDGRHGPSAVDGSLTRRIQPRVEGERLRSEPDSAERLGTNQGGLIPFPAEQGATYVA